MNKDIPQFEPSFGVEEQQAVYEYMGSGGWYTESKRTVQFENEISTLLGVKYTSAVNNGTISLSLALLALGVKPGDAVIVPDITMIASATAVSLIGACPVFIDVEPRTLCLNLAQATEEVLNRSLGSQPVRAVIYVSLNGRSHSSIELKTFHQFLINRGIGLIEDAAQSFGSKTPDGVVIGTIGDIGSFSFSPHKIVSTGQGGCLVTNTTCMWEKIERLKDFGRLSGGGDVHEHFGINSKFTDIQAVIGSEQLKKLPSRIVKKQRIYQDYQTALVGMPEIQFAPTDLNTTVPWFMDIYVSARHELTEYLKINGIGTRPIYPALHTQKLYPTTAWRTLYPVSSAMSLKGLWLPSSLNLSDEDIERVCATIKSFYRS